VPESTEHPEPENVSPAGSAAELCPTCQRPIALPKMRLQPFTPNENEVLVRLRTGQDRVTDGITSFAGSMRFVYIHAGWFAMWIAINAGLFGAALVFDEFPYGLLTMIVSLEAIFLSTFVMISQNRQAARADVRAELDFETNLRSEIWSVEIGRRLGLDPHAVEEHVQAIVVASKEQISGPIGSVAQDAFNPDAA
jgi:uncharacterized membrane protein